MSIITARVECLMADGLWGKCENSKCRNRKRIVTVNNNPTSKMIELVRGHNGKK